MILCNSYLSKAEESKWCDKDWHKIYILEVVQFHTEKMCIVILKLVMNGEWGIYHCNILATVFIVEWNRWQNTSFSKTEYPSVNDPAFNKFLLCLTPVYYPILLMSCRPHQCRMKERNTVLNVIFEFLRQYLMPLEDSQIQEYPNINLYWILP